jgi:hypothetical protein
MDAIKFKKLLKQETGQKWKIQKVWTETGTYVVYKNKETGEYVAYNMEKFDRKGKMTYDQYMAIAIDGTDVVTDLDRNSEWIDTSHWSTVTYYDGDWVWDDYDEEWDACDTCGSSWTEDVWVEDGYTYYWYTGNGFSFSNTELNVSRDLETLSGLAETAQVNLMSLAIQSELSLSSNRAKELAKLSVKFNKLENIRELSEKEKDYFAINALGVSFNDLTSAYKDSVSNNKDSFKSLMQKAAKLNNTTSDKLESYVSEYLSVELEN